MMHVTTDSTTRTVAVRYDQPEPLVRFLGTDNGAIRFKVRDGIPVPPESVIRQAVADVADHAVPEDGDLLASRAAYEAVRDRRCERTASPCSGRMISPERKLEIVQTAMQPGACIPDIARAHNIGSSTLYKWRSEVRRALLKASVLREEAEALTERIAEAVTKYVETNATADRVPPRFPIPPEIRDAAARDYLAGHGSLREISDLYGISLSGLHRWVERLRRARKAVSQ